MIKVLKETSTNDYSYLQNTITFKKNNDNDLFLIDKSLQIEKIIIEKDVNIKIIEKGYSNSNITIEVNRNAVIDYTALFSTNMKRSFKVFRDSNINYHFIELEASNDELNAFLLEENASFITNALVILKETDAILTQTVLHEAKSTISRINNFGCAMINSNINFITTGHIKNGMSKSDCRQLSKGVVMDDHASVTSKPILLIDEYDVNAYHGASIGKMSDEDLFYLMSRGLNKTDAFKLILTGIVNPFLNSISDDTIKEEVSSSINNLLR